MINVFLVVGFVLTALVILLGFLLTLLLSKTHAWEELKASFGNKTILLIDAGGRWLWRVAKDDFGNGLLKLKGFTFVKTPYSVKYDDKKIPFAVAIPQSAYLVNSDVALIADKAYDEKKSIFRTAIKNERGETIELPSVEKEAEENNKKVEVKGITVNFDKIIHYFKALSPSSVNAKIQYEVANALEKSRSVLSFQNVMLIIMLLLGGAIAFAIIKGTMGGGSTTIVQHVVNVSKNLTKPALVG